MSCCVETILPYPTATASALLTSMLSVSRRSSGWTPEECRKNVGDKIPSRNKGKTRLDEGQARREWLIAMMMYDECQRVRAKFLINAV
ncbi:hypothetical protein QQP08_019239 [Theobroma cacao]|nr:hypothetical protein QQP08_019239 [Theobroma cacao]